MPSPTTTRLNRPWLAKMAIFTIALLGFGIYGLYDATVAYPARGRRYADYARWEYFRTANQRGPLSRDVSVADPAAELARLERMPNPGPEERAKTEWLRSLSLVGRLKPQHTTTDDPDATFRELNARWTKAQGAVAAPKPLAWYDIPVQWLFVGVGFGGGAWLALLWVMVARQKYGWDAASLRLELPGGQSLRPSDLEDVDKRKWDKFLVFLKVKPPHPLAGRELKLDLYRHAPLEAWVLEMEKAAFPDRAQKEEPAPPAEPPAPEPAGV